MSTEGGAAWDVNRRKTRWGVDVSFHLKEQTKAKRKEETKWQGELTREQVYNKETTKN